MALVERNTVSPENLDHTKLTAEAALSGLVGVVVATIFLALVPAVGLPRVMLPEILGRIMTGTGPDWAFAHLVAWVMYLAVGVGLAIAYGWFVERVSPRNGALEAAVCAAVPWMLIQVVVLPLAGYGFFGSELERPVGQAVVTLLAAVLYGLVAGSLLQAQVIRTALPVIEHQPSPVHE